MRRNFGCGVGTLAVLTALPVAAQQATGVASNPDAILSEVIVTGVRQSGIRAQDSPAPIQLFAGETLQRSGASDLAGALEQNVPSLNISTTGQDTASMTVQAALRGLSPNDTLVLVNGKRRHATSNLAVDAGSAYSGAATADLSFIPVSMIDHVEVLTDGAAAQYGTDAIAGVVNIILESANSGGLLDATGGAYYDRQGGSGDVQFNKGIALGDRGFINLSLEDRFHDFSVQGIGDGRFQNPDGTPRAGLSYPDSNIVNAQGYPSENHVYGDPQFNLYNAFLNSAYNLSESVKFYGFGSYSGRIARHYANYRGPSKVEGETSTGELVIPFPNGFDPLEQIDERDYALTAGLTGETSGWRWDLSATYGDDRNKIYVVHSANAQLFPVLQAQSPTPITPQSTFYDGAYDASELTYNLDVAKNVDIGLASPLSVAFGGEARHNIFKLTAGEPASYYGAGAQSFVGYTPLDQGSQGRTNTAGYIDLAADLVHGLHADIAGRFEHYSDFGDTSIGKVTLRYDFNPAFALRGTFSTGFRAPTLAEEFYSGTNVAPTFAQVQLPPNSAAAKLAGFGPLKPEESTSGSIGLVANPAPHLRVTADFYDIRLRDRILPSGFLYGTNTVDNQVVTISQGVLDSIAARGVVLDSGLSYAGISLFTNAADTETRGAEVTANYASDFDGFGKVDWSLGVNYNDVKVNHLAPLPQAVTNAEAGQTAVLTPYALTALTTATPRTKTILQASWTWKSWAVTLRERIYGATSQYSPDSSFEQKIGTTAITDLDVGYHILSAVKVSVGANNLFNTFPPRVAAGANGFPVGGTLVFDEPYKFSPYGINGGYFYGRITVTF